MMMQKNFSEGLAGVFFQNQWGYIDKKNEKVIPMIYNKVNDFKDNLARVKKYGNWQYIDKNGKTQYFKVKIPYDVNYEKNIEKYRLAHEAGMFIKYYDLNVDGVLFEFDSMRKRAIFRQQLLFDAEREKAHVKIKK